MEVVYTLSPTLPNLKNKPYGGAWSIHNSEVLAFVKIHHKPYSNTDVQQFLQDYSQWMCGGHTIHGIDQFKHLAYANGTTEVFDKFYLKHTDKRLRLWPGEYFYHQIQGREIFKKFAWINEGPIKQNDVVVVSMPFANTGGIPDGYQQVLEQCEILNVPVMIDMAYLNISKSANFNVDFKCITTIATSLSKVFPVETLRIGMRLEREFIDDTLSAYINQDNPYMNHSAAHVGHRLISNYSSQWVWKTYFQQQHDMCAKLNIAPSNCVIFGVDHKGDYPEYSRGSTKNRLCFSRIWDKRITE
jgi:histidinol-phosphate/aromatic aminotransferase/cobyric acid decarboxylase-like protein